MIDVFRGHERICTAELADSFLSRFIGLMMRKKLVSDKGLLIEFSSHLGSKSIHSFFMRFTIDLIFIDKGKHVVETASLKPWSLYNPKTNPAWVLEVNNGFILEKQIKKGDSLSFKN